MTKDKNLPVNLPDTKKLKSVVEEQLTATNGKFAVLVKNLKTGESYNLREDEIYEAGSLYKLWLMGATFEEIKNGNLNEDDNLEANIPDLNNLFGINKEDAELKEGHLQLTVKSAVEQMITISHNYAALLLLTKVPNGSVESFIKKYGLTHSTMELPIRTTAQDIALYFEKLYKGEIIDPEVSANMLGVLKRQKIGDRLPKALPEGTVIAHKTADFGFFEHDGGLVFSPGGDYIIVVLTETSSPNDAGKQIAQISKAVFEYFNI